MISQGLFNLILISSVNDIVNGSIHMGSLRKGYTLPAIRFSAVTSTPIVTNNGTASLNYQRIQFDAIASTYLDAQSLKDALKALLDDYTGTLAEGTVIYSSILKMELDNPLEEGRGGYAFRSVLDYEFGFDPSGIPVIIAPTPDVVLDLDDMGLPQFDSGN